MQGIDDNWWANYGTLQQTRPINIYNLQQKMMYANLSYGSINPRSETQGPTTQPVPD